MNEDTRRRQGWMTIGAGVALMLFEVVRNWGAWDVAWSSWAIDYVIGAFLVVGGWSALRSGARGNSLMMIAAWGSAWAVLTSSFMGNVEKLVREVPNFGPIPQGIYVVIVGCAWAGGAAMLVWCLKEGWKVTR